MPLARIPGSVSLHVSENGYPTGPGRTEAMQVASMKAAIATINAARRTYNITSYTWFDLRDANTSSGSFQSQYGVLRDDYSPKPAFAVYRRLVAKLSSTSRMAAPVGEVTIPILCGKRGKGRLRSGAKRPSD